MDLYPMLRDLYGAGWPLGCTDAEIDAVRRRFGMLPAAVADFWRAYGRTKRLNLVQDTWCLPEHYDKWSWLVKSGDLILLEENQGVCQAVIRREDLSLPDPPVYIRQNSGECALSAETTSAFLEAALLYEGVWQLQHAPEEFYWLSEADLAVVQKKLTRHTAVLRNWFVEETTFYSSRPDNLVVIMDMKDEYQCLYGGATEEGYAALLEVMEGLGEPL